MAGPGDDRAAEQGRGCGGIRASHADREQVVAVLKAAFVQGRLDKGELDARVGQAFVSRTYAELAALTADIPAGSALTPPRQPARARNRAPVSNNVRDVAIGLVVGLSLAAALVFSGLFAAVALLGLLASPVLLMVVPWVVLNAVAASSQRRRSRGQLPARPGQGTHGVEGRQPGRAGHDPALPRDRPDQARADRARADQARADQARADQARADLRADSPRPGRPRTSGRYARAPRGTQPVPGAA